MRTPTITWTNAVSGPLNPPDETSDETDAPVSPVTTSDETDAPVLPGTSPINSPIRLPIQPLPKRYRPS